MTLQERFTNLPRVQGVGPSHPGALGLHVFCSFLLDGFLPASTGRPAPRQLRPPGVSLSPLSPLSSSLSSLSVLLKPLGVGSQVVSHFVSRLLKLSIGRPGWRGDLFDLQTIHSRRSGLLSRALEAELAGAVTRAVPLFAPEHGERGEGEAVDVAGLPPVQLRLLRVLRRLVTLTEVRLLRLGDGAARVAPGGRFPGERSPLAERCGEAVSGQGQAASLPTLVLVWLHVGSEDGVRDTSSPSH